MFLPILPGEGPILEPMSDPKIFHSGRKKLPKIFLSGPNFALKIFFQAKPGQKILPLAEKGTHSRKVAGKLAPRKRALRAEIDS